MKVINLLNKIAKGEDVPKEIEYRNIIFRYDYYNQCYIQKNYDKYNDLLMQLSDHTGTDLNYEVEIIEEDKEIEKIGNDYYHKTQPEQNQIFKNKINEIIDILNNL